MGRWSLPPWRWQTPHPSAVGGLPEGLVPAGAGRLEDLLLQRGCLPASLDAEAPEHLVVGGDRLRRPAQVGEGDALLEEGSRHLVAEGRLVPARPLRVEGRRVSRANGSEVAGAPEHLVAGLDLLLPQVLAPQGDPPVA